MLGPVPEHVLNRIFDRIRDNAIENRRQRELGNCPNHPKNRNNRANRVQKKVA